MEASDLIKQTVFDLEEDIFKKCRSALLNTHICFSFIDAVDVTKYTLAEKLSDYFEALENVTDKTFDKLIKAYLKNLDLIVEPHIPKAEKVKKGSKIHETNCRARKYYERAEVIRDLAAPEFFQLRDYTRIMICLYMAALNEQKTSKGVVISDFDFAASCLEPDIIIKVIQEEVLPGVLPHTKKNLFWAEDKYCTQTCSLILLILLLFHIVNVWKKGDPEYGQ